ncbi:MAG: hypothetical protein ABI134_35245 [Byssovorax sp.]
MSAAEWVKALRGTPHEEACRLVAKLDKSAERPTSAAEIEALAVHYKATALALRILIAVRAAAAPGEAIDTLKAAAAIEVTRWLERHPAQYAVRAPITALDISVVETPMEVSIETTGWWAYVKRDDLQEIGDGVAAQDPREALGQFINRLRGDL